MNVSVLIPTRGRPEALRRSIASVLDLAKRPSDVEVLVAADVDDPSLPEIREIVASSGGKVYCDERHGYARLHVYFNLLAAASRGMWLINWNDDTDMVTWGWDELLAAAPPGKVQFLRRDEIREADPTFPATHRSVYEAMGHLSLNAHCDAWISDVSWWADVQVIRNDVVFHHHCLADKTAGERVDDMPRFKGAEQTQFRAVDIERVRALARKST